MRKALLLLISILTFSSYSFAAPGDTTIVSVHSATDMTWYGSYDAWGVFPSAGTTYEQVIMVYTMGCASTGCSDWDYTTSILLRDPTGIMDSTVASVDSISGDTTWNVFEVVDQYVLGKVITPYGGYMANGMYGYSNAWTHDHAFDVTDYQNKLRDSVEIRAFYSGWTSGFSATVDFIFIEGTPPRDVIDTKLLWKDFPYTDAVDVNTNLLPEHGITFSTEMKGARIVTSISGHGIDDLGCAEFCKKYYKISVDSVDVFQKNIWKKKCGMNPIYPQGGTWIYERANWCPGSRVPLSHIEITPYVTAGNTHKLNMNMESYSWSGNRPYYSNNGVLFIYDSINHGLDAAIVDIVTPSTKKDHRRFNPSCDKVRVEVMNKGAADLTSIEFSYQVAGGPAWTYTWTGILAFMDSEVIELPVPDPTVIFNATLKEIEVEIVNANGMTDDVANNNYYHTEFETLTEMPWEFIIHLKTNNRANQNSYVLTDADGTVLYSRLGMSNNTLYEDTVELADGCFELYLEDTEGNGLSWWAAPSEGDGYFLLKYMDGSPIKGFQPDFGSAVIHQFIVQGSAFSTNSINPSDLTIYPNPSNGMISLEIEGDLVATHIQVIDLAGRSVFEMALDDSNSDRIDLSNLSNGHYQIVISTNKGRVVKQHQIQH